MSRTYSSFVLICVVTQGFTDVPEGLCQREIRKYQQVTKISSRRCTTRYWYCPTIQSEYCLYRIKYYKCTFLQYLQVAKVKVTYTCCDGYYFRNGECKTDTGNVTPGTTCNTSLCNDTCTNDNTTVTGNLPVPTEANKIATTGTKCNTRLCNDTCTNDTTSVTGNLPVHTEANKIEDTKWNTSAYNDSCEKKTTTSIGFSSTHKDGNQTEGESRDISMIVAVLLAVVVLTIVAVIICWKVRHHRKPKTQSLEEIELQPPQNIPWDQNAAHETEDIELRDESGIYFSLEPRDDQTAYENINYEFPHDADGTRNPYDTVDRRNRYSIEADPREDVNGQGVTDSKDESDIYHHLNRNRKETYNTDVYGILSGVELSQIQL